MHVVVIGSRLAEQRLLAAALMHREGADPVEVLEDCALGTVALAVVRAAARQHSIGARRRRDEAPTRKQST